jgi:hypothetical protein
MRRLVAFPGGEGSSLMARKVIGPTGSRRRRWLFLCTAMAAIAMAVLFIPSAFAVHDEGVFQLDGNALTSLGSTPAMPTATDDADSICGMFHGSNDGTNPAGNDRCNVPGTTQNPGSFPTASTTTSRASFVTDGSGPFPSGAADDQYTGGSKDSSDISTWVYKNAASSNDKSDIQNAFAAFYTAGNGDKLVYFGGDRTSNSGDENTAFWFLQSPAKETVCSNISGSGCPFTQDGTVGGTPATHVAANPGPDNCLVPQGQTTGISFTTGLACTGSSVGDSYGDILVVSAFTGGGNLPNTTAYEWIGNGFAKGASTQFCGTSSCTTLKILDTSPGCSPTLTGDSACAITDQNVKYQTCPSTGQCVAGQNPMPTASPWLYSEKSSDNTNSGANACTTAANKFCPGVYFEAGLNLTKLGLQSECTSTFVMDTRSSQSVDSSLQDLAVGQVGSCGTAISTTPKNGAGDTTAPDDPSSANALSIGTGTVTATDLADLTVTGTGSWTGTLKFFLCGPITVGTCDGTTNVGLQIGSDMTVGPSSGTSDGSGGRLIGSSAALLTSAANKSTGAPGHYCWRAEFHSGTTNVPDKADSSTTECFVVNPVTPTLSTSASCTDSLGAAASPCILGDTLSDTATLGGTATEPGTTGPNSVFPSIYQGNATPTLSKAGGTITWTLYPPDSSGNTQCTTTQSLTTSTAAVTGNDTYPTASQPPISYSTTVSDPIGTWTFAASYGGDNPNTLNKSDSCSTTSPDTNEQVTVTATSSTATAQSWLPQDTAIISATGGTPAGTVTFSLYESADCSGTAVQTFSDRPVALNTGDSQYEASTNNSTYYTTTKTISWRAVFSSTNGIPGSTSHCETMSVSTLNNDLGPGS